MCQVRLLGEQIEVDQAVALAEKEVLVVGSALRDVVRHAGRYDSGSPRHAN